VCSSSTLHTCALLNADIVREGCTHFTLYRRSRCVFDMRMQLMLELTRRSCMQVSLFKFQHPPLAAVWVCIIVQGHTGSPHEHKRAVGFSIGARPAVGKTGPG